MLGTVGKKEEELRAVGDLLGNIQQERAYLLAKGTAPGVAGAQEVYAAFG